MKASLAALIAIVLGIIGGRAEAQPALTPPSMVPPAAASVPAPPRVRAGFLVGGDLGFGGMRSNGGSIDCVDCQSEPPSIGMRLELGAMLRPRLGLFAGFDIALKPVMQSSQTDVVQQSMVLDIMYWTSRRLWLSAGLGAGKLESVCNGCTPQTLDTGLGFDGGLGYELVSSPRFGLDARFRLALVHYSNLADTVVASTFAIGIRWFGTR